MDSSPKEKNIFVYLETFCGPNNFETLWLSMYGQIKFYIFLMFCSWRRVNDDRMYIWVNFPFISNTNSWKIIIFISLSLYSFSVLVCYFSA